METKTIVQLACLAATTAFYSIMLFTQKARRAKVLQKAGDCLYELTKPAKSKTPYEIRATMQELRMTKEARTRAQRPGLGV